MAATFCLRLACGMIVVLPILPTTIVPPRFFRVQFLVALGLLAVAAVFLYDTAGAAFWIGWTAAMLCCIAGSIVWHLDKAPGGKQLIWLAALVLLACLVYGEITVYATEVLQGRWRRVLPALGTANVFTSMALLGTATTAMLMGHSYLISPTMSIGPLLRLLIALGAALTLRIGLACAALWLWSAHAGMPEGELVAWHFGTREGELLVWLPARWALGLLGPLALGWMAWETARIRSTQSATGILYVVVIVCYLGELTSQLLLEKTGLLL